MNASGETRGNESRPEIITTGLITLKGGAFIRLLAARYCLPYLLGIAFLIFTGCVLGITLDLRWLIVALMILFLIFPMVAALLYFNHGLKEVTVLNTLPHRLSFTTDSIELTAYEDEEIIRNKTLPYSLFSPYYIAPGGLMVPLADSVKGFVWIPAEGFEDREMYRKAVERLAEGIRKNNKSKFNSHDRL